LLQRPADLIGSAAEARHPNLPLPRDLLEPQRVNSRGVEFGDRAALADLLHDIADQPPTIAAAPLIEGNAIAAARQPRLSPIDVETPVGTVAEATP